MWWIPSKRGLFGVRSFHNAMSCNDSFRSPWMSVWQTKASLRLAFFFLVGSPKKDPCHGQPLEVVRHCG